VIKGETALLQDGEHTQNINELYSIKNANSTYKKVITALFAAIIVVIIASFYLWTKLKNYG